MIPKVSDLCLSTCTLRYDDRDSTQPKQEVTLAGTSCLEGGGVTFID